MCSAGAPVPGAPLAPSPSLRPKTLPGREDPLTSDIRPQGWGAPAQGSRGGSPPGPPRLSRPSLPGRRARI